MDLYIWQSYGRACESPLFLALILSTNETQHGELELKADCSFKEEGQPTLL